MVTCYVRYVLDPFKLQEFETYAKMWIPLVQKLGGTHHGYFLPGEGASAMSARSSGRSSADLAVAQVRSSVIVRLVSMDMAPQRSN